MNYKRWTDEKRTDEEMLAKLAEEFGEVARAQSARLRASASKSPGKRGIKQHTRNLVDELEHLEFIASSWKDKITQYDPDYKSKR